MINQKLYVSKTFGSDVKALETVSEGMCKVWNFKKEKVEYVDVDLYREMDEDVARCYESADLEVHTPKLGAVRKKKDLNLRIAYYTRKVAEMSSIHPSKALPAAYKFRSQRLILYKRLMHEQMAAAGYTK